MQCHGAQLAARLLQPNEGMQKDRKGEKKPPKTKQACEKSFFFFPFIYCAHLISCWPKIHSHKHINDTDNV